MTMEQELRNYKYALEIISSDSEIKFNFNEKVFLVPFDDNVEFEISLDRAKEIHDVWFIEGCDGIINLITDSACLEEAS